MILSVDVQYEGTHAVIAGLAFERWEDERESAIFTSRLEGIEEYTSGEFYRRELPCILKLLEEHGLKPETMVIDGFVYLDGISVPGLGKHLYDALKGEVCVIGVAKRRYRGIPPECEVLRGKSARPIYVTSVRLPLEQAIGHVRSMHGGHRIPTLLKKTDQACRNRLIASPIPSLPLEVREGIETFSF